MFKRTLVTMSVSALVLSAMGCISEIVAPAPRPTSQAVEIAPVDGEPIATNYGNGVLPCITAHADLNGDGYVDAGDIAAFASLMRADLNGDSYIDAGDIAALGQYFGSKDLRADFNGDGFVDAGDIAAFSAMRDRADINGDGSVAPSDLEAINQRLGQEVTEPCPS